MSTIARADQPASVTRPLTMTVEEAAALIGISRSSAYDAVHRGDLPARRIGHRILVLAYPLYELFAAAPAAVTDPADDATT
jgi:excisionase family DNA binding protein